MPRVVSDRYLDPLDVVWVRTAERLGFTVDFSDEVYASYDGKGKITLSTVPDRDADDCVAQMIFHEICHGIVQGPENEAVLDWGLDPDAVDPTPEHACVRMQAALAQRYGLRGFFGVTTDWRPYWDALPADPLAEDGDPAVPVAREAWVRALSGPWSAALHDAMTATAAISAAVRPFAQSPSLWARG